MKENNTKIDCKWYLDSPRPRYYAHEKAYHKLSESAYFSLHDLNLSDEKEYILRKYIPDNTNIPNKYELFKNKILRGYHKYYDFYYKGCKWENFPIEVVKKLKKDKELKSILYQNNLSMKIKKHNTGYNLYYIQIKEKYIPNIFQPLKNILILTAIFLTMLYIILK